MCAADSVRLSAGSAVAVDRVPATLTPTIRRLSRRLALGLFLDTWPAWAAGALLAAGCVALVCKLFVPTASTSLPWLLAAPVLAVAPAWLLSARRSYRSGDVLALADALTGGDGLLLTLSERPADEWGHGAQVMRAAHLALPRLRPWRRLAIVAPAFAFLVIALLLPQRVRASDSSAIADEIVAGLSASLAQLQSHDLVTPEEEKKLEEEIERVRKAAQQRMDASAWEAADAVKEKLTARAAAKQDAAKWAQEALAAYAAAVADGLDAKDVAGPRAELSRALEALAKSGMLAGAPADLQKMLGAGSKLPADAATLSQLAASLGDYLGDLQAILGELRSGDGMPARFDPADFAVPSDSGGGGLPGRGGLNRGRADAELTWGEETLPADRFKPQALPPGFIRSPDDWAPIVNMPGAPSVAPETNGRSAPRVYGDDAGQAAWRRTLAPRHQSAVKKYFSPENP